MGGGGKEGGRSLLAISRWLCDAAAASRRRVRGISIVEEKFILQLGDRPAGHNVSLKLLTTLSFLKAQNVAKLEKKTT